MTSLHEVENLEIFYLIWLGNLVNNELQQQLRTIINYLLIFEDEQQCLQYIHSLTKDERIIFIVKGKLGQQIVPHIASLQQISSIYVYSNDKKTNEQWTKNFKKIKGISIRREELLQKIQAEHTERQSHKFDEILSYSIFKSKKTQEKFVSTNFNDHCIYSQMLIDCLIHMELFPNDKNEFIALCKQQYQNNLTELNIIEEFERDYSSERSLWWFTRHSFLYRLLVKAMKVQNIDLLLYFRFFIHDIKQQLEKTRLLSSIRVYRAQLIAKEELELLTKCIGDFISINSFLSTSPNREQTRYSLSSSILTDEMEKVFFEINANSQLDNNNIFSNITSCSYFPNREEILFMIGSIFRLVHIDRDIDGIWNIQLILCSNKDHQLQSIIKHKKNELEIVDTDILSFGFILEDMAKFDDAEKYYYYVLNVLPKDHENVARCYHALGELTQKKDDFDSSIKWYNKSLEIDRQMSKIDDPNIAISYNSLAVVYSKKGDYTLALKSYQNALEILKRTLGEDHPDTAMCYNNIGIVYQEERNYSEALECYHKAWNIRQKYLPVEHPSLGQSHACVGNVHYHLGHYDLALEHYTLSLEIFRKSLLSIDQNIGMILRNIGLVYQGKGEFQQALSYLEKALVIYRHSLPLTHPDIIQIEQIIRRISSKL